MAAGTFRICSEDEIEEARKHRFSTVVTMVGIKLWKLWFA
jgi:hypothetical protein